MKVQAVKQYDYQYQITFFGNSTAGKGALVCRFVTGHYKLDGPERSTAFLTKTIQVEGKAIRLEIWDTAGQERYHSLAPMFYRNAQGAMIVFDLTDQSTYDNVTQQFIKDIKKNTPENFPKLLVGNKCDLEEQRVVAYQTAKQFADEFGIGYIETSAKTGENVEQAFMQLATEIYTQTIQSKEFENDSLSHLKTVILTKAHEQREESLKEASLLPLQLAAYELAQVLGAQYYHLLAAIHSLETVDKKRALSVDKHAEALASLGILLALHPAEENNLRMALSQLLATALPVYHFISKAQPLKELLAVGNTVLKAIDMLHNSHWSWRYTALPYLECIYVLYEEAISHFKVANANPQHLIPYQEQASLVVVGGGHYHLPVDSARKLLCVDKKGLIVKDNAYGTHALYAANGVHYKPNMSLDMPIQPGKEYAVSSLIQLIAGNSLAAAPTTLLSVDKIAVESDSRDRKTLSGLVQAGLTITGICFKDFLECQATLESWQSRLSLEEVVALLEDEQKGAQSALRIARQRFPEVFECLMTSDADSEQLHTEALANLAQLIKEAPLANHHSRLLTLLITVLGICLPVSQLAEHAPILESLISAYETALGASFMTLQESGTMSKK